MPANKKNVNRIGKGMGKMIESVAD